MKRLAWTAGLIATIGIVHAAEPLPPAIVKLMQQPQYANSTWTLYVKDLTSNKVDYDLNANRYFAPGSAGKLFAVAAFLNTFGIKGTIQTPVYALGKVDDEGVLNGDLVLVAKGDLVLGGRLLPANKIAYTAADHSYANVLGAELTPQDPLAGLQSLAQQIKNNGIKEIDGNVVIDVRYFTPYVERNVRISPIFINENLLDFVITPGNPDAPATITWRPQISTIKVTNKVVTVQPNQDSRITIKSNPAGNEIEVLGTIAVGSKPMVNTFPIQDPTQFAHDAFVEALTQQGIKVNERPDDVIPLPQVASYESMKPVAVLTSPEMLEYAKLILKVSHNTGANLIPALLAASHGKTTYDDGMGFLGQFLANTAHVDPTQTVFAGDAAGKGQYVTALAMMQLLEYFYHLPNQQFQSVLYALPVLGEDGSLAAVAQSTPAKGQIFAKSGTGVEINRLNNGIFMSAKGLAGYYQDKNKHWKAFVLSLNNDVLKQSSDVQPISNDLGLIVSALFEQQNPD